MSGVPDTLPFPISRGGYDVLAERHRHGVEEGWTPEHDDGHGHGELARAAVAYLVHYATHATSKKFAALPPGDWWPWGRRFWKPKAPRDCLVKVGALVLAEIDRLDRRTGGAS